MEKIFEKLNTISEVYAAASHLKSEGKDAAEVNRLATKRKKELMMCKSSFKSKLTKVVPTITANHNQKYTGFLFKVQHLNDNKIQIGLKEFII